VAYYIRQIKDFWLCMSVCQCQYAHDCLHFCGCVCDKLRGGGGGVLTWGWVEHRQRVRTQVDCVDKKSTATRGGSRTPTIIIPLIIIITGCCWRIFSAAETVVSCTKRKETDRDRHSDREHTHARTTETDRQTEHAHERLAQEITLLNS